VHVRFLIVYSRHISYRKGLGHTITRMYAKLIGYPKVTMLTDAINSSAKYFLPLSVSAVPSLG